MNWLEAEILYLGIFSIFYVSMMFPVELLKSKITLLSKPGVGSREWAAEICFSQAYPGYQERILLTPGFSEFATLTRIGHVPLQVYFNLFKFAVAARPAVCRRRCRAPRRDKRLRVWTCNSPPATWNNFFTWKFWSLRANFNHKLIYLVAFLKIPIPVHELTNLSPILST